MVPNTVFSKLELMQGRVSFVPDGWKFIHLNKAFKVRNNLRLPISEEERSKIPGKYPYYGPTKIQGYIGDYQQDGEFVLIGEDGDHFLKFSTKQMTQLVDGKCTVNNHAHIIEGTDIASREWFYYYFMHRDIFSFLTRQGAGRYKLNKAALKQLPVLVPPLPEQKKIAKILSTWDRAIEVTEKLLNNSQQQKKSLMQQLLTGKKRLLGFSGEWVVGRVGDLVGKIYGGGTPSRGIANYWDGEIPWVTVKDLIAERITGAQEYITKVGFQNSATNIVSSGTVIIATRMAVGKAVVSTCDVAINQDLKAISASDKVDSSYIHYWFLFYSKLIEKMGTGSTVKGVQVSAIKCMEMCVPPTIQEQQKITSVLSTADKEIETLQQKLNHLKQEKKALMQQLLTGKRRVAL